MKRIEEEVTDINIIFVYNWIATTVTSSSGDPENLVYL